MFLRPTSKAPPPTTTVISIVRGLETTTTALSQEDFHVPTTTEKRILLALHIFPWETTRGKRKISCH
jgi:hypothetical protein